MGSSPLTRGKLMVGPFGLVWLGLIPAHAGKTRIDSAFTLLCRAHPRSRGENFALDGDEDNVRGSSPLTRGKPTWNDAQQLGVGLIPAHAGKTPYGTTAHLQSGAHPRSRGENCR